jgi:hypothetical protein
MIKKYSSWLCLFLLLSACSKYNTNLKELPTWQSDWLIPMVKGQVSFENIKKFSDSKTTFNIPSLDIGYASGVNINVPPINLPQVGPYAQPLSDWIHSVNFDTLQISLQFQNAFPIPIGAGTQFSFRRSSQVNDPNNIIYTHTLPYDIAPNETYAFDIRVINNYLSDTVFLYLEQFNSPGGNNVIFSNNPSKVNLTVKIIDINRVELNAGKFETETDTVDIDFSNEDLGNDTASYGKLNFFIDNALPIHFYIQVYFLNPVTAQITDSLLAPPFVSNGCTTNASGDPTSVTTNNTSISLSTVRINKIKESTRAIISYKINTLNYPPPYVIMSDKCYLKMQITGDLHLSFNLNSL